MKTTLPVVVLASNISVAVSFVECVGILPGGGRTDGTPPEFAAANAPAEAPCTIAGGSSSVGGEPAGDHPLWADRPDPGANTWCADDTAANAGILTSPS